jgi:hypothetical protein
MAHSLALGILGKPVWLYASSHTQLGLMALTVLLALA